MAANGERTFKHFKEVLPELRSMVVDEMHPEDRCRFSGSSKSSNKEAKNSKNYIYQLSITVASRDEVDITVRFGQYEKYPNAVFDLRMERENGIKYMEHTSRGGEMCRTQLDNSIDLEYFGVQHFCYLLERYQNTIKRLTILTDFPEGLDFQVTSLKNLEELVVEHNPRAPLLLSLTRRPLKQLRIFIDDDHEDNIEKILRVKHTLEVPDLELNYEQFLQLSALHIEINIGELTPENISNFIRMWQEGMIGRNVKCVRWSLLMIGSEFDTEQLFRLLGSRDYNRETRNVLDLNHFREAGKHARITSDDSELEVNFYYGRGNENNADEGGEDIVAEENDNAANREDENMAVAENENFVNEEDQDIA